MAALAHAMSAFKLGRGVNKWPVLAVGGLLVFVITIAGVRWLSAYMKEGVVQTATLNGNLIIGLHGDERTLQALVESCASGKPQTRDAARLLRAGGLVEIPSGTAVRFISWGDDRVGTVILTQGELKGVRSGYVELNSRSDTLGHSILSLRQRLWRPEAKPDL